MLSWERGYGHVTIEERCEWPDYKPRDTRSAKSRQVWIARHLQWPAQWFKNPGIPGLVCGPAGPCPALAGLPVGAGQGSAGTGALSAQAGLVSGAGDCRLAMESEEGISHDGWLLMSETTSAQAYTGRWLGRRTMGGDTTYLGASRSGAGEAAKGAVLPPSWLCGALLPSVIRVLLTAALPGTGRRT